MSVDFTSEINNFLNAELGEDVRGSLVDITLALQSAINSQLITVDPTLSQAEAGADAKVVGSFIDNFDLLHIIEKTTSTSNHITFTANKDGSFAVNGTASAAAFKNYFYNKSSFPSGISAGKSYYVKFSGINVEAQIWWYKNSAYYDGINTKVDREITIPVDAEGLLIRLHVENGAVVDETVNLMLTNIYNRGLIGVDRTLALYNIGADAKIVGDNFARARLVAGSTVGGDADDIVTNGVYFSSDSTPISNMPQTVGWLEVTKFNTLVLQVFYPYTSGYEPQRRVKQFGGTWSNWEYLSIANSNSYTINNNTYNVTASPTVNEGIPYVLESTGDSTDRTSDIATILSQNGVCILGSGSFYVSNLTIPNGCCLKGNGISNTKIVMASAASGDAVSLSNYTSIADLTVYGGEITKPSADDGRNGIGWVGTYISPENPGDGIYRGQISNVQVHGFSGAGIHCANTSMDISCCLNVVNVNIYRCYYGINIVKYSEYHRFTNVEISSCVYGCINNGGNNMFLNCGFNANDTGFYIDNSGNKSPNNSHGSCVGCTINHSGSNTGTAIKLDGVSHGFVFSACQIFYGKLDIKNSVGVNVTGCNISNVSIDIDGGGLVLFTSNIFKTNPTVTKINTPTVVGVNNYLTNGTSVTI